MSIIRAVQLATSSIAEQYFELPVARRPPIKRERVYCYELYHRLRNELGERNLALTAEPDKRGNPDFDKKRAPNPDLIIHIPGTNRQNIAVIEVECRPDLRHIRKDLRTLKLMKTKGYRVLILLLFGVDQVPWKRLTKAALEVELSLTDFEVLLHRSAGQNASVERPPQSRAA